MIGDFIKLNREIPTVDPEVIFMVGSWPITNSFLMTFLILFASILFALLFVRRFKVSPTKTQNVMEVLIENIEDLLMQITGDKKQAQFIFPVIATLFIYIGFANLLGLIPGVANLQFEGEQLFRTATSDFNTTFGLALAAVFVIQLASIKDWGVLGYIGRFIKIKELVNGFKKGIKEGFIAVIEFFVGLMDIVGELARIVSLSLRLFGNIFAGEVLAVLILGALAYLLPALWVSINLLFAVVQAMVFGSLVTAYYMLSLKPKEVKEKSKNSR